MKKRKTNITHGLSYHPIYGLWKAIIKRCNSKGVHYKYYRGKGIRVCAEWRNNPKAFVEWAEANGWQEDLQIDRIDNDKNYSPDNCRFATASENCLNSRLLRTNNTSGFRGVSYKKGDKKYEASIKVRRKHYYLGHFVTAIEAAQARDAFVIEHKLHAPLNFPTFTKEAP